jgi:hypothetical protein
MDKNGKVYFTVNVQKSADEGIKKTVIENINKSRNLGLSQSEMNSFAKNTTVGVPFTGLKSLLAMSDEDRLKVKQPGIPVTDTLNNELTTWVATAVSAFQGHKLNYMIKGDNAAKYPSFKGIIDALRKNDINKYQLITDPEGVPAGTDLYKIQEAKRK